MQQAGEDCRRHIRADAVVGEGRAITFSVGVPSLSPLFWIILCLRDSRKDDVEGISPPIKNAGGFQSEILAGGKRRKIPLLFYLPLGQPELQKTIPRRSSFVIH